VRRIKMEIVKTISLFGKATVGDVIVANLNATISNNGSNYNIGVNFVDKSLIDLTEENKETYKLQYDEFEQMVNSYLV
jgi:nicotinamide riboside kinase